MENHVPVETLLELSVLIQRALTIADEWALWDIAVGLDRAQRAIEARNLPIESFAPVPLPDDHIMA